MATIRIRMTYSPTGENLSREVWDNKLVGIWYGAWTPNEFLKNAEESNKDAARILNRMPAQKHLGWPIKPAHIATARRFVNINRSDWILVYFDQTLHLGRAISPMLAAPIKKFEREGEPFKARRVGACKEFCLSDLPECFRLLACAGRSAVHDINSAALFAEMLGNCSTAAEVNKRFQQLSWREWVDALGPKGWETLCQAYLTLEAGYLPTGLATGGTLPDFDLVGRNRNGYPILAQCKKEPGVYIPSQSDLAAFESAANAILYIFAYGGMRNKPKNAKVITADEISEWFEQSDNGKEYRKILTGDIIL